ncbi:MAG: DOMON-like domain-containing protein [Sphingomicrobium sp.]
MQFDLVLHPNTPPGGAAFKVWASVDHIASLGLVATTNIWFGVGAPASRFVIPKMSEPWRSDELWRTTCFDAFLQPAGADSYREWNFAPSGNWAAYDFPRYREDMARAEVGSPPYIRMEDNFTWWTVGATIAVDAGQPWQLGLSAVLEEKDGTKSYWALAHPAGDKPDFHHPDCFTAQLA